MWFERAIFSSLLAVIALTAVPFGAVEPWWEAIFESTVFMLGACWISSSMIGKRWRIPAVLAPISGLIVLACLQTLPLWRANFSPTLTPVASEALSVDPFETKRFVIKLRDYSLEFTTADTTQVILIGVAHEAEPDGPCPIFGSVLLDDFSLGKI